MKKLFAAVLVMMAVAWAQPAAACGMFMPRTIQADSSRMLLVRARNYERSSESRTALRLYERIMYDRRANKRRRSIAAYSAYRLRAGLGQNDRAAARLRLAVEINPRNRAAAATLARLERAPQPIGETVIAVRSVRQ